MVTHPEARSVAPSSISDHAARRRFTAPSTPLVRGSSTESRHQKRSSFPISAPESSTIGSSNPAVLYTGSWFTGDDSDGDATLHGTRTAGSNVTFTFNGTFAAAYGTVDASGARFTYTIDSAAPEPVALPGLTPPDHTAVLFSTPQLAFGEHTLLMSNTQDGPTLWLEYITYTGAELERRADQVRNASQPGAASPQQPKHAGLPPSTVVLVVLCSLLFLAILVVGGWLVHRRRHRWHLDRPVNDPSFKEHGFDILPNDREGMHVIEAIRIKLLGALRSRSRTHPGMPTMPPLSSTTLFTSVIMPPSSVGTSHRS